MERIIIIALSALISAVALVVAAAVLISGQIQKQGLDALFLILVCLLLVAAFLPIPVQAFRRGELQAALKRAKGEAKDKKNATATAAPQQEPVAQRKTEESG
ncbi:MAG: hypothetical protein KIT09_21560 [Bryobacteraceae bacterium]|nr:hypothetical protein [Bryobacteraceae bacterium]